ncbi:hypothetical protein VTK56DRAFT_5592 [Thermocarpiscus australiensis]
MATENTEMATETATEMTILAGWTSSTPKPDGQTGPNDGDDGPPLPLRRSVRVRKRASSASEDADNQKRPSATPPSVTERRHPKRKAAPEVFDLPGDLLEASLGPWKESEQSEWASWAELESDPAFFTAILRLLGVRGAKIEEMLSVDEYSLATLPEPVYGLVFLYEYVEEDSPTVTETSQDVWFANQTAHNACATIALLNIIMNAEGMLLGEKLRKFKQESMDLSPPLRGNMITNSEWIRMAHNSFARRLDLLNAALSLQNEVDKKKRAKPSSARRKKTKLGEDKSTADSTYHFIAFVPVGQRVWQLDGLKPAPVCIGEYAHGQHWTAVMRPVLEARMARYETGRLSFSLLALCGDGLTYLRRRLATNIRCLEALRAKFNGKPGFSPSDTTSDPGIICSSTDGALSAYQLDADDIQTLSESDGDPRLSQLKECSGPPSDMEMVETGLRLWEELSDEQNRIRSDYNKELTIGGQEPATILGRTKDHTAAIHEWVKKLIDHGVLRKLHEQVQLHSSL